jgi:hypothetical protein
MKSQKFTFLATGLLAFSAAAIVGWSAGSDSSTSNSPSEDGTTRATQLSERKASNTGMRNLRALGGEQDRMRASIEMARTLPSSEIRQWLDSGKFNLRRGYALTLFQKIAFERWSQEEPVDFITWVGENQSSDYGAHLANILKNHPEALQEALSSITEPHKKGHLLWSISRKNPALALAEIQKMMPLPAQELSSLQGCFGVLVKDHYADLEAIKEQLTGNSRTQLEKVLIGHRIKDNFDEIFDSLLDRPDAYKLILGDYSVSRNIKPEDLIARLPDFPPAWRDALASSPHRLFSGDRKKMGKWLEMDWKASGFSAEQAKKINEYAFNYAVQVNPELSLALFSDQDFSEEKKRNLLEMVVNRTNSAEKQSEYLTTLTSPEDQALMQELIDKKEKPVEVASQIKTPDDLITALTEGKLATSNNPFSYLMRNWKPEDRAQISEAFNDLVGEEKARLAGFASSAGYGVEPELRGEAIKYLLENPEVQETAGWKEGRRYGGVEIASRYALELMKTDPSKASSWVNSLPEGPQQLWAKKNLAANWQNYDPDAVEKWISSQPASQQKEIVDFLKEGN